MLAIAGGTELVSKILQVFFQKETSPSSKVVIVQVLSLVCHNYPVAMSQLLSAIVNRTWSELARHGNLQNWREILAVLVTYAGPEDFATLCGKSIVYNMYISDNDMLLFYW